MSKRQDTIISTIGLVIALGILLFVLSRLDVNAIERQREDQLEQTGLGDVLIFPEGWTPVTCESESRRDSNMNDCTWVCKSVDDIYRYCIPTIQAPTSE